MPRDTLNPMDQHPLGIRQTVMHMCPECGTAAHNFCPVCLGTGLVSTERLARWQWQQDRTLAA